MQRLGVFGEGERHEDDGIDEVQGGRCERRRCLLSRGERPEREDCDLRGAECRDGSLGSWLAG